MWTKCIFALVISSVLSLVHAAELGTTTKTITMANSIPSRGISGPPSAATAFTATLNPIPSSVASGGKLRVTLPIGFEVASSQTILSVNYNSQPVAVASNAVSGSRTLTITLGAGATLAAGGGPLVVVFNAFTPPFTLPAQTNGIFQTLTSADVVIDESSSVNVAAVTPSTVVTPTNAMAMANPVVGATTAMTIQFTPPIALDPGYYLTIQFPPYVTNNYLGTSVCSISGSEITPTYPDSPTTMRVVVPTGGFSSAPSLLTCSNYKSSREVMDRTPGFTINVYHSNTRLIGSTSNAAFAAISAAPLGADVKTAIVADPRSGVSSELTVTIKPFYNTLEPNDRVVVTMPTPYTIGFGADVQCSATYNGANVALTTTTEKATGQFWTSITNGLVADPAHTFVLKCSGIRAPKYRYTGTPAEVATYRAASGKMVDRSIQFSTSNIVETVMATVQKNLAHTSTTTSNTGNFTLTLQPLTVELTPGDSIEFTFPLGYVSNPDTTVCTVFQNNVPVPMQSTYKEFGMLRAIVNGPVSNEASLVTTVVCTEVTAPTIVTSPGSAGTVLTRTPSPDLFIRNTASNVPTPGVTAGDLGTTRRSIRATDMRSGEKAFLIVEIIGFNTALSQNDALTFGVPSTWTFEETTFNQSNTWIWVNQQRINDQVFTMQYTPGTMGADHTFVLVFTTLATVIPRGLNTVLHLRLPLATTTAPIPLTSGHVLFSKNGAGVLRDTASAPQITMEGTYPAGISTGTTTSTSALSDYAVAAVSTLTTTLAPLSADLRQGDRCVVTVQAPFGFNSATPTCTIVNLLDSSSVLVTGTSVPLTSGIGLVATLSIGNAAPSSAQGIKITCSNIKNPPFAGVSSTVQFHCERPASTLPYPPTTGAPTVLTYARTLQAVVSTTSAIEPSKIALKELKVTPHSLFGGQSTRVNVTFNTLSTPLLSGEIINVTFPLADWDLGTRAPSCVMYNGANLVPNLSADKGFIVTGTKVVLWLTVRDTVPANDVDKTLFCDGLPTFNAYRSARETVLIETFTDKLVPKEASYKLAPVPEILGTIVTPSYRSSSRLGPGANPALVDMVATTGIPETLAANDELVFKLPSPHVFRAAGPQALKLQANSGAFADVTGTVSEDRTTLVLSFASGLTGPASLTLSFNQALDATQTFGSNTDLSQLRIFTRRGATVLSGLPTITATRFDHARALKGSIRLSNIDPNTLSTPLQQGDFLAALEEELAYAISISRTRYLTVRAQWIQEGRLNDIGDGKPLLKLNNYRILSDSLVYVDFYIQIRSRLDEATSPTSAQVVDVKTSTEAVIATVATMNVPSAKYISKIDVTYPASLIPIFLPTSDASSWPPVGAVTSATVSSTLDYIEVLLTQPTALPRPGRLTTTFALAGSPTAVHRWYSCENALASDTSARLSPDWAANFAAATVSNEHAAGPGAASYPGPWCRWASATSLHITSRTSMRDFKIAVGGAVSINHVNVRSADAISAACVIDPCVTKGTEVPAAQSASLVVPTLQPAPVVTLVAPAQIGPCQTVTLNAAATNDMGRAHVYEWSVVSVDPATADTTALAEFLSGQVLASTTVANALFPAQTSITFKAVAKQWTGGSGQATITVKKEPTVLPNIRIESAYTFSRYVDNSLTPSIDVVTCSSSDPYSIAYTWSQVSGATVSIPSGSLSSISLVLPVGTFTNPGAYGFRFTAKLNTTAITSTAEVIINIPNVSPPVVQSAELIASGRGLVLKYDQPTNRYGVTSSAAQYALCEKILATATLAKLAAVSGAAGGTLCQFTSRSEVLVLFGNGPTIAIGDNVGILAGATLPDGTGGASAAQTVPLIAPASVSGAFPAPSIAYSPTHSQCIPLTLDASQSTTGGMGRPLTYGWSLVSVSPADPAFVATVNNYITTTYGSSPAHPASITIPSSTLVSYTGTLTFELLAWNWLNKVGSQRVSIALSNEDTPVVRVVGPTSIRTVRSRAVQVPINIVSLGCASPTKTVSSVKWEYLPPPTLFDVIANQTRSALYIPANSLPPGGPYNFRVTLTTSTSKTATASVAITVDALPLRAVIQGGASRALSLFGAQFPNTTVYTLHANSSSDPNFVYNTSPMSFSWKCTFSPSGRPCDYGGYDFALPASGAGSGVFQVPAGALRATDTSTREAYNFTVTVTSSMSPGLVTSASQLITVTDSPLPVVEVSAMSQDSGASSSFIANYLPHRETVFICTFSYGGSKVPVGVFTAGGYTFRLQWSLLSTASGLTEDITSLLKPGSSSTNQRIVLKAGALLGRDGYTLKCKVSPVLNTLLVTPPVPVNVRPSAGSATVSLAGSQRAVDVDVDVKVKVPAFAPVSSVVAAGHTTAVSPSFLAAADQRLFKSYASAYSMQMDKKRLTSGPSTSSSASSPSSSDVALAALDLDAPDMAAFLSETDMLSSDPNDADDVVVASRGAQLARLRQQTRSQQVWEVRSMLEHWIAQDIPTSLMGYTAPSISPSPATSASPAPRASSSPLASPSLLSSSLHDAGADVSSYAARAAALRRAELLPRLSIANDTDAAREYFDAFETGFGLTSAIAYDSGLVLSSYPDEITELAVESVLSYIHVPVVTPRVHLQALRRIRAAEIMESLFPSSSSSPSSLAKAASADSYAHIYGPSSAEATNPEAAAAAAVPSAHLPAAFRLESLVTEPMLSATGHDVSAAMSLLATTPVDGDASVNLPVRMAPFGGMCATSSSTVAFNTPLTISCSNWAALDDRVLVTPSLQYRFSLKVPHQITHIMINTTLDAPYLWLTDFQPSSSITLPVLPFATPTGSSSDLATFPPTTLNLRVEVQSALGAITYVDLEVTVTPPLPTTTTPEFVSGLVNGLFTTARTELRDGDVNRYTTTALTMMTLTMGAYVNNTNLGGAQRTSLISTAASLRSLVLEDLTFIKKLQVASRTSENELRHLVLASMATSPVLVMETTTLDRANTVVSVTHDSLLRMCGAGMAATPNAATPLIDSISLGLAAITKGKADDLIKVSSDPPALAARNLVQDIMACFPRLLLTGKYAGDASVSFTSPFVHIHVVRVYGPSGVPGKSFTLNGAAFTNAATTNEYPRELSAPLNSIPSLLPTNETSMVGVTLPPNVFSTVPGGISEYTSVDAALTIFNDNYFSWFGQNSSVITSQVVDFTVYNSETQDALKISGIGKDLLGVNATDAERAQNIKIQFPRPAVDPKYVDYSDYCQFWDKSQTAWVLTGCAPKYDPATDYYVTCYCNHLTSFASVLAPPIDFNDHIESLYYLSWTNVLKRPRPFVTGAIIMAIPFILWVIAWMRDQWLQELAMVGVLDSLMVVKETGVMFPQKLLMREQRNIAYIESSRKVLGRFFLRTLLANHSWCCLSRHKFSPLSSQMRLFILGFNTMGIFLITAALTSGAPDQYNTNVAALGLVGALVMLVPSLIIVTLLTSQNHNPFFEFVNQVFIDLYKIDATRQKAIAAKKAARLARETGEAPAPIASAHNLDTNVKVDLMSDIAEPGTGKVVERAQHADVVGEQFREEWVMRHGEHFDRVTRQYLGVVDESSTDAARAKAFRARTDFFNRMTWAYTGALPPHLYYRFIVQQSFWAPSSDVDPNDLWLLWNSRSWSQKTSGRSMFAFLGIMALSVVFWIGICAAGVTFDNSPDVPNRWILSGGIGLIFDVFLIQPLVTVFYFFLIYAFKRWGTPEEVSPPHAVSFALSIAERDCLELTRMVAHANFTSEETQVMVLQSATPEVLEAVKLAEAEEAAACGEDLDAAVADYRASMHLGSPNDAGAGSPAGTRRNAQRRASMHLGVEDYDEGAVSPGGPGSGDIEMGTLGASAVSPRAAVSASGRRMSLFQEASERPRAGELTGFGSGARSPMGPRVAHSSRHSWHITMDPAIAAEAAARLAQFDEDDEKRRPDDEAKGEGVEMTAVTSASPMNSQVPARRIARPLGSGSALTAVRIIKTDDDAGDATDGTKEPSAAPAASSATSATTAASVANAAAPGRTAPAAASTGAGVGVTARPQLRKAAPSRTGPSSGASAPGGAVSAASGPGPSASREHSRSDIASTVDGSDSVSDSRALGYTESDANLHSVSDARAAGPTTRGPGGAVRGRVVRRVIIGSRVVGSGATGSGGVVAASGDAVGVGASDDPNAPQPGPGRRIVRRVLVRRGVPRGASAGSAVTREEGQASSSAAAGGDSAHASAKDDYLGEEVGRALAVSGDRDRDDGHVEGGGGGQSSTMHHHHHHHHGPTGDVTAGVPVLISEESEDDEEAGTNVHVALPPRAGSAVFVPRDFPIPQNRSARGVRGGGVVGRTSGTQPADVHISLQGSPDHNDDDNDDDDDDEHN